MIKNNLPKWTTDRIVFVIVCILLIAAGIWVYFLSRQLRSARRDAKIQTILVDHTQTLNADSMRSAVEKNLQAGYQAIIANYEARVKLLNNENQRVKSENKSLRAAFDTIVIDRPDF